MPERVWRKGNSPTLWVGMPTGIATMENSMKVPLKTKNGVTILTCGPTPGHITRDNSNLKRYMHPNVHSSTIYNSQDTEATWLFTNTQMDKEDRTDTHNGISLSHKKEQTMPFAATWMNPKIIIPREVSQRQRHISYDITRVISITN